MQHGLIAQLNIARENYARFRNSQDKSINKLETAICAGKFSSAAVEMAAKMKLIVPGERQSYYIRLV